MRKGTTLLLLATIALGGVAWLTTDSWEAEAEPAPTRTHKVRSAPPAIVIFPASDKPNPSDVGMNPSVYNHFLHEDKVDNCEACHHTRDTVACTGCHTVEGKSEGNFITLAQAMHSHNIAERPEGEITPQSCVSCHKRQIKRLECAGCHSVVKPTRNDAQCATCHSVTPSMTNAQMQKGITNTLPPEENLALAEETIKARQPVPYLTPEQGPYKVLIDGISGHFERNMFAHRRHVETMMGKVKDDQLAQRFHSRPETLCATCHHNAPLSATPPKCGSCHKATNDKEHPDRTPLKAAYHLMCMGCHTGMQVARPEDTSCTTCHKERAPQRAD